MNFSQSFYIYFSLLPVFLFLFQCINANPLSTSSSEDTVTTTISTSVEPKMEITNNENEIKYENAEMPRPNEQLTTTHPTFTVERLDAPIERIEIRLIDENNTKTEVNGGKQLTVESSATDQPIPKEDNEYHNITQKPHEIATNDEAAHIQTPTDQPVPTMSSFSDSNSMYKKVEYVVQATDDSPITSTPSSDSHDPNSSDPVPVAEDPSYFSTMSTSSQATSDIQAKAWISVSVSTTIPKFEGDIDEDDLPPPQSREDENDEKEPEEECLANKDQLSDEVVTRLKAETAHYYRLVRQRNEQQKEYCTGENAVNQHSDMYRRCSDWRAEKLVYYYKLMRKTYCQVENWPNPSKVKKTYGEYLNLFGTFYAFQK